MVNKYTMNETKQQAFCSVLLYYRQRERESNHHHHHLCTMASAAWPSSSLQLVLRLLDPPRLKAAL